MLESEVVDRHTSGGGAICRINFRTPLANLSHCKPSHDVLRTVARFTAQRIENKAIVDSRLRPQWCFHLANITEMEEMFHCKLDALIRSFAFEKRFSCQHKSARIMGPLTLTLTLTLSTPWMHAGVHRVQVWWRSGHLPAISDGQCKFSTSVHCSVTKWQTDYNTSLPLAGEVTSPVYATTILRICVSDILCTLSKRLNTSSYFLHQQLIPYCYSSCCSSKKA